MTVEVLPSTIKLIKYEGDWILGSLTHEPRNKDEAQLIRISYPVSFDENNVLFHYPKNSFTNNYILIKEAFISVATYPDKEILKKYTKFADLYLIGADVFYDDNKHNYKEIFVDIDDLAPEITSE